MPSLKDLKGRISSVKSTQKITKAKQMVAAAKLRRAQEAAEASKPYAMRMSSVIANLTSAAGESSSGPKLLSGTGSDERHLIVVMTAERGLCGGFNANVVKQARITIRALETAGKSVKIITVGKKGRDQLARTHGSLLIAHVDTSEARGSEGLSEVALDLGRDLNARFENDEFDVCTLVFSRFVSVMTQAPTAKQLIPAEPPEETPVIDLKGATYIYEPSEEDILEALLPRYLNTLLLSAMLESASRRTGGFDDGNGQCHA